VYGKEFSPLIDLEILPLIDLEILKIVTNLTEEVDRATEEVARA